MLAPLDELVRQLTEELRCRYAQGEAPRVEEYLSRYPQLSQSREHLLEAIQTEYELRVQAGDPPSCAELSGRFGELEAAVRERLGQASSTVGNSPHDPHRTIHDHRGQPQSASSSPHVLSSGESVSLGSYTIVREIGRGAMGIVYEAESLRDGRRVALKTLPTDRTASLLRFKSEFRTLQDLTHENLIQMFDLCTSGPQPFFTMELVDGDSFLDYVRAGYDSDRPGAAARFDETRLRRGLLQLARGVQALHDAGKLHRDLKPTNVIVRRTDQRVMVLDFGLAVNLAENDAYRTAHVAGTPRYMAPEQWRGNVFPASDWYAVGVMLFEALTGGTPADFRGRGSGRGLPTDPRAYAPDLPDDLAELCTRLLQPRPEDRPSGEEVLRQVSAGRMERPAKATWVGRERELERLRQAADEVRQGRALAVFVQGDSGIGKTSLVNHFLHLLGKQHTTLLFRGRCFEGESVAYNAFDGAVDGLAGYLAKLPEARAERLLPLSTVDLCRVFPVFREVKACQRPQQGAPLHGNEQESRQRAFVALRELLTRLARFEPALVVLFLDDLQRCDRDSADLFNELLRLPRPPEILLIAALRQDDLAASQFVSSIAKFDQPERVRKDFAEQWRIMLTGLSPEEVARLAEWHGQAARAEEIARESGGVPIFIDYLLESDLAAAAAPAGAGDRLSLAVELSRRLAGLPAAQHQLLRFIAVAGRPVDGQMAARAAGLVDGETAVLADLRRQRFVKMITGSDGADLVETYHDRVRDVVCQHLSGEEVRAFSAKLALALEAQQPSARDAEWLAELFARGGLTAAAGRYSYQAAHSAQEKLAFAKAADLYRRALQWLTCSPSEEADLRERLATALSHAGRSRDAAAEFLRASALCDGARATELRCRAALRYLTSGHLLDGLATLRGVLQEVGLRYPSSRAAAISTLLYQRLRLWLRGLRVRTPRQSADSLHRLRLNVTWSAAAGLSVTAPLQAATFVSRNLRLALDAGETHDLVRALAAQIGHLAIGGGRSRRAVAHYLQALRRAAADYRSDEAAEVASRPYETSRRQLHPYAKATREMARGIAAHLRGEWDSARRSCDRASRYLQDPACRDVNWELDTARTFSLWCLMYTGDFGELARRQPNLLGLAQENDDLFAVLNFGTIVMTSVLLAADDPPEARRRLCEDQRRLTPSAFFVQHHNWLLASTLLELYEGDALAAWQVIEHGWRRYAASLLSHVQQVRINFLETYGRAALAAAAVTENPHALLAQAARAARRLERENVAWAFALAQVLEAGSAQVRGDSDQACVALEKSVTLLQALPMRLYAAAAQWHLGRLRAGQAGAELSRDAESLMRKLGIVNPARMAGALVTGFDCRSQRLSENGDKPPDDDPPARSDRCSERFEAGQR